MTARNYVLQPSGAYHLYYCTGRKRWHLDKCRTCNSPLEYYKQSDGAYAIHHRCKCHIAGSVPPAPIITGRPAEDKHRTYTERLEEGFRMLDEDC